MIGLRQRRIVSEGAGEIVLHEHLDEALGRHLLDVGAGGEGLVRAGDHDRAHPVRGVHLGQGGAELVAASGRSARSAPRAGSAGSGRRGPRPPRSGSRRPQDASSMAARGSISTAAVPFKPAGARAGGGCITRDTVVNPLKMWELGRRSPARSGSARDLRPGKTRATTRSAMPAQRAPSKGKRSANVPARPRGHLRAHPPTRPVQPGLRGLRPACRDARAACLRAQPLHVAQHDHQAERLGQPVDALLQQPADLGAPGLGLGTGGRGRGERRSRRPSVRVRGLELGEVGPRPAPALAAERLVERDAREPGRELPPRRGTPPGLVKART